MDWFRAWAGVSTDPKYLVVMRNSGADGAQVLGIWVALMDHASQARPRGSIEQFDLETYAAFASIAPERVQAVITALGPGGPLARPLHDGARLAAWSKRQPAAADVTAAERMRRLRAKKKAQKSGTDKAAGPPEGQDVTDRYGRNGGDVTRNVTGYETEEKQSFSDASRQACEFDTSLGNTSHRAQAMKPGDVWQALEAAGIPATFMARKWNASHIASWTQAGITAEQLGEAIARASAARERAKDSRPLNIGYLEAFVTEVRSGLPPKTTTRTSSHELADAAAADYLRQR